MLEYESPHIHSSMASRVVIKLGGGLITDKGSMKKFDPDSVERVAESISSVVEMGVPIIIVHGAGSFGHLLAKEWSISEGVDKNCLLYTSPSPRDRTRSRMPSSA